MVDAVRASRSLPLLPAVLLAAAIPAISLTPASRAHADAAHGTLDVADVKIGMKGYGLTVFKGTEPEKFDVEVVGILSQFRPNQDLLLIKTPHERLNIAHTVAGMSGSPIFLDGKMIGAYAYGWQFGAEPLAGVTPIKNMLQDLAHPVPPELLRPIPVAPPHGPVKQSASKPLRGKHASLDGPGNGWDGAIESYDVAQHAKQVGGRVAASLSAPTGSGLAAASTMVSLSGLGDR